MAVVDSQKASSVTFAKFDDWISGAHFWLLVGAVTCVLGPHLLEGLAVSVRHRHSLFPEEHID